MLSIQGMRASGISNAKAKNQPLNSSKVSIPFSPPNQVRDYSTTSQRLAASFTECPSTLSFLYLHFNYQLGHKCRFRDSESFTM
jgi:hypothetical protein